VCVPKSEIRNPKSETKSEGEKGEIGKRRGPATGIGASSVKRDLRKVERVVVPELLDQLVAEDPAARRSRQDLRRLNWCMGHVQLMRKSLEGVRGLDSPGTLIELGGGDGTFLLKLARQMARRGGGRRALLIDRHDVVLKETRQGFEKLGWGFEVVKTDIADWLAEAPPHKNAAMFANLVLHHFEGAELQEILGHAAMKTTRFVACEPRRSPFALQASRLVGLIGCGPVTRHDAVVSVQAGFTGNELSQLWPAGSGWHLEEREAGLFSHVFAASQRNGV